MRVSRIVLGIALVYILAGCEAVSDSALERRIARVEGGLLAEQGDPPWKQMDLTDRMGHYRVPGVSISVINDGGIEWVKGYGVLESGKDELVTTETLFQTASIAKPIVSAAALSFVERGELKLDEDVNRKLVSWQVPENEYTAVSPVTLRGLLSHIAGITVGGFRGYASGEAVPNLQQILDGEPPANSPPVRVDLIPGTQYRYSGGGYMIVEQLLVDVSGEPLDAIIQETIFGPLEMERSTFKTPLPEAMWSMAASGHRSNGRVIPGRWHTYPEMGAGASMWSTPSDMATFVIDLMSTYAGESGMLSQEMAVEMLTPQIGGRGLGFYVGDDGGDRLYFLHSGANDGYKSYLIGYPLRGQGLVIMTNSDNGDALAEEILNSVSVEYGWLKNYNWLYLGIVGVVAFILTGYFTQRKKRSG